MTTIRIPIDVQTLMNELIINGYEAYVVGGAVRDSILGKSPKDWDLTTNATPDEMLNVFKNYTTIPTGLKHGTLTVRLNDESYEITTYRCDGKYSDGRHPDDVTFVNSLKEDVLRRDLTINALAADINGFVIDYVEGLPDLLHKPIIIRTVGDAKDRFTEDSLRMFRALRFAARYNADLDYKILLVIRNFADDATNPLYIHFISLSVERIMTEVKQIILTDDDIILNALMYLLLKYPGFTTINKLKDIPASFNTNNMNGIDYAIDAITLLPRDYILRFAVILRIATQYYGDVSVIFRNNKTCLHTTHTHILLTGCSSDIKELENEFKLSKEEAKVLNYLAYVTKISPDDEGIRFALSELACDNLPLSLLRDYFIITEALDKDSYINQEWILNKLVDVLSTNPPLTFKDLAITGNDVLDVGIDNKKVGDVLIDCLNEVLTDPQKNTREYLLAHIKDMAKYI